MTATDKLHDAVLVQNIENFHAALEEGANVNTFVWPASNANIPAYFQPRIGSFGVTPLHVAVAYGNKEMVEGLLQRGINIDEVVRGNSNSTALFIALSTNNLDIAEMLFQCGANVDLEGGNFKETPRKLANRSLLGKQDPAQRRIYEAIAQSPAPEQKVSISTGPVI